MRRFRQCVVFNTSCVANFPSVITLIMIMTREADTDSTATLSLRKLSVAVDHVQYKLQQKRNLHGFDPQLDHRFKLLKNRL